MGHSIYLADDEKSIRELLHSFLASDGYTVRSFESGDALLEAFRQEPAELVILDIMLPGRSGYEVCRMLPAAGSTVVYTPPGCPRATGSERAPGRRGRSPILAGCSRSTCTRTSYRPNGRTWPRNTATRGFR